MKKQIVSLIFCMSMLMMPANIYAENISPVGSGSMSPVVSLPDEQSQEISTSNGSVVEEGYSKSAEFAKMSLGEKYNFIMDAFDKMKATHEWIQVELIKTSDLAHLDEMEKVIESEAVDSNDLYKQTNQMMSDISKREDKELHRNEVRKMLVSMQESRQSAMLLFEQIATKKQALQAGERALLSRVAKKEEQSGNKEEALELYAKISLMQKGDVNALFQISRIVKGNMNDYLFLNHEMITFKKGMIERSGKKYLPVTELERIGFSYQDDVSMQTKTIRYDNRTLSLQDGRISLDGVLVGSPLFVYEENGESFVDVNMLFNFFGFQVKYIDAMGMFYVTKPVFTLYGMDGLTVDEMLKTVLN